MIDVDLNTKGTTDPIRPEIFQSIYIFVPPGLSGQQSDQARQMIHHLQLHQHQALLEAQGQGSAENKLTPSHNNAFDGPTVANGVSPQSNHPPLVQSKVGVEFVRNKNNNCKIFTRKSLPPALILVLREFPTGHRSTQILPPPRRLHPPLAWRTIRLVMQLLLVAPVTKFLTMRLEPGSQRERRRRRKVEVSMVKEDGVGAEVGAVLVEEIVATAEGVVEMEVEVVIGGDTGEDVGVVRENLMKRERIGPVEGDYSTYTLQLETCKLTFLLFQHRPRWRIQRRTRQRKRAWGTEGRSQWLP